jgi:hypothetical protein
MPFSPGQKGTLFALVLAGFEAIGCTGRALPDPRAAADDYARALETGDSDAVYEMLTSDARREHGRRGVQKLLRGSKQELLRNARAVTGERSKVEMRATLRFADGEQAELPVDDGEFRVGSAGTLPEGARTPAEALSALRQALARRSYAGILRVLSTESKSSLENDVRSLVDGLDQPETLDVKISGDSAEVTIPGGHSVKLKREGGVWRVEDFD